jgi:uncharacterized protein DUF6335
MGATLALARFVLTRIAGGVTMAQKTNRPEETADDQEPRHAPSPTALAAEAARTGVNPSEVLPNDEARIPGQDDLLRIGDADVDPLQNAYVGDEAPGFDMATPDQDEVDAVGRAYGVSEEDSGPLRPSAEIADARDRRRAFQEEPEPTED